MNFPFICSNIPATPVYRVYISQFIQYFRTCGSYPELLDRKILNKGFLDAKLESSRGKFYGRHYDLVNRYICVINHHGYVLFVVITFRSFLQS